MNVLSLFDGISCGQLALQRAEIKYDNYFASEIYKHAIKVTQHHFPNTIQLGDVCKVKAQDLPKIDLLIGGSPCQGFSFYGKKLNFNDPKSKLFFEYSRLLKECIPRYFLLENVKMKKESENVISKELEVKPIKINSSFVSAQNRIRNYWTNIKFNSIVEQNIYLSDIVERNIDVRCILGAIPKYVNLNDKFKIYLDYNFISSVGYYDSLFKIKKENRILICKSNEKAKTQLTTTNSITRYLIHDGILRLLLPIEMERLQTIPDNYTDLLADSQRVKCIGNAWTVDVVANIFKGLSNYNSKKQRKFAFTIK